VPIPNDKYVPEVTRLIRSARKRVWVAMLDARYYETRPVPPDRDKRRPKDAPPSLTNVLLADLQDAARRGVDVEVVCDMGRGGPGSVPNNKLAFLKKITEAGGKAYWDSPEVTTHAKIAIVDDDFTVIGSTNWSQPAVEDNNETAVVIESPEINQHYAGFIERVKGQAFDPRPIGEASRPQP
jgi:phosphatidylserine/phosphatidylglycerophosphate/cardiolipin synthase-like enzyme